MTLRLLDLAEAWALEAKVKINAALTYLDGLQASVTAEITAAVTAHESAWASHAEALRGHIAGLTLSNNGTDATNDIDIAVGVATSSDQGAVISLGSALTKQLDASWAVGTNAGMRATGAAITDTTYHIFLIRRPDTGVVDIAADTSASGANIAANTNAAYTQVRRIGSILRESGAIVTFKQWGDNFRRAAISDRNSTSAAASALLALSIPAGIAVAPMILYFLQVATSATCQVRLGSASIGSADTTIASLICGAGDTSERNLELVPPYFVSDTSRQIYFEQINTAGTPAASQLFTVGWVDLRGKDA